MIVNSLLFVNRSQLTGHMEKLPERIPHLARDCVTIRRTRHSGRARLVGRDPESSERTCTEYFLLLNFLLDRLTPPALDFLNKKIYYTLVHHLA